MDSITTADVVSIVAIAICLLLSFFFSGSETALTASSRARMTALEGNGDRRARLVNRLMAQRERLIGAVLLGNNLANIAASSLATGILLYWFGDVGIAYATVVMTVIIVVFSEVLPKTIAINHPDRVSLLVARPIAAFVALLGPVTLAMEAFVRWVLKLAGVRLGSIENVLSGHDELRGAVDVLHREGSVVKADRDMFGGVLDLRELHVSDVMVHRTKMSAVNADDAAEQIMRGVLAAAYTRVPLWRGMPENIVGVLHVKDILRAFDEAEGNADKIDIASITLPPWFVPDTTTLHDQLRAFLRRKTHFALVVDEYGEVMGLVTLEDILEEIVGDIADEHDVALTGVRPQADGSVTVDGGVPIRDLNRAMDWNLPDEGATTIAGLVIHEARLIPEAGQTFTFHGFRFQVLRKNRNRVTLLRIKPLARAEPAPTGQAA
jgi:Mg2+/Co2+ transporter CorB